MAAGLTGTALALPADAATRHRPPGTSAPPCSGRQLSVTLTTSGGGAAGSLYARLVLHNTSATACLTGGYAGVSYTGAPQRSQIGAAADWTDLNQARTLLLPPGGRALATLREVDAGNYPPRLCRPQTTSGLRVYPPNQTTARFLPQHTLGCRNPAVHLLSLTPFGLR